MPTIVDLAREVYHRAPAYPGQPPILYAEWKNHEDAFSDSGGVWGNALNFVTMPEHGTTHLDAPRHFHRDATPMNEYPLEHCIVRGVCIDLRRVAPRAEIGPDALDEAARKTGLSIPKGGTLLLCTGHHARTYPTKAYSTDNPGVNVEATEWLADQGIVHFGIDSMRPGPEGDVNALVHKTCWERGITHLESLCNLEALLGRGEFQFIALPLKFREGTGSPVRAVAVLDD